MFEKMKLKATKCKEWVMNHKVELAYIAGGAVGVIGTSLAYNYLDKKDHTDTIKKYPGETGVLSMRKNADYIDYKYGTDGNTRLDELSDSLIANGGIADSLVVGALVYTKNVD